MNIKPTSGQHSALFTELNELKKINQTAKDDNPEALRQVAQQFEQVFMSMLMKSMREANESFGEDNFLNSSQVQFYEEMLDSQMTLELAQKGGMGLADVLVKQLSKQLDIPAGSSQRKEDRESEFELSRTERMLSRAFDPAGTPSVSGLPESTNVRQGLEVPPSAPPVLSSEPRSQVQPVAVKTEASEPERFATPESFVAAISPIAESIAGEIGVNPNVLVAQAALETGWGKHLVRSENGGSSYNLFNIKADNRWSGDRATTNTLEFRNGLPQKERAAFRVYSGYEESFRDYVNFIQENPRYQQALESAADPLGYLQQLQKAGYATDPQYAEKISNILDSEFLASGPVDKNKG